MTVVHEIISLISSPPHLHPCYSLFVDGMHFIAPWFALGCVTCFVQRYVGESQHRSVTSIGFKRYHILLSHIYTCHHHKEDLSQLACWCREDEWHMVDSQFCSMDQSPYSYSLGHRPPPICRWRANQSKISINLHLILRHMTNWCLLLDATAIL